MGEAVPNQVKGKGNSNSGQLRPGETISPNFFLIGKPVVFPPPRKNDGLDLVEPGGSEANPLNKTADSLTAGLEW